MIIHIAITGQLPRTRMVQLFLRHVGNINAKNGNGNTALHILLTTSLRSLIPDAEFQKEGVDMHTKPGPFNLHEDAKEIFRLLLHHHADTNDINNKADTALHVACSEGVFDAVNILIQHPVDLDTRGTQGRTALVAALLRGRRQIAILLLSSGVDPTILDTEGTSALHLAAKHNMEAVVHLLIGKTDLDVRVVSRPSAGCEIPFSCWG